MAFRSAKVTTEPTQVAPYNPERLCLVLVNVSSPTVFISDDPRDILTKGFPVPQGTVVSFIALLGDATQRAYYAQVASGEGELRIIESWKSPELLEILRVAGVVR
jgi:hypothetical protein